MRIAITKGQAEDRVAIERPDGSRVAFSFPKKGPTPHDAYHLFAEQELGMARGFWGLVASGMDPSEVGALAAAGGHASANRAQVPDDGIVQLLQAERLVEAFEAESWVGGDDDDGIMAMAEAGWAASHVTPPAGVAAHLPAIRRAIQNFALAWQSLPCGDSLTLKWHQPEN